MRRMQETRWRRLILSTRFWKEVEEEEKEEEKANTIRNKKENEYVAGVHKRPLLPLC
jgi:hypothetical protein